VVSLDSTSLSAGCAPFADRDGGDPAQTAVTLAGVDVDAGSACANTALPVLDDHRHRRSTTR
jgi:hypothetical protein